MSMVKLLVTKAYSNTYATYKVGQVVELEEGRATFLLNNYPGHFVVHEETVTGLTVPDRRMRGGRVR